MKIPFHCSNNATRGVLYVMALALAACPVAFGQMNTITVTYGSGKPYQTTVERQSEGNLSAEDLHQASLLTSQLLIHVNAAAEDMVDARTNEARAEIDKAQSLAKIVHDLLPTTVVTTTVKNSLGQEVYHDEQQVQDDQIPIYTGDVAVEVVQPIIEAKKAEAALNGVKLNDAELVHTAVLVDLGFVERKLERAEELIAKPQEAASELALAQTDGVHFFTNREDNPLVNAQIALRLAERMVMEKKYDSAKENLETAKLQLEAYRTLVGEDAGQAAAALEKQIQIVSDALQTPQATDTIRGMWDLVTSWFQSEPGQAHQVTNSVEKFSPGG